MVLKTSKEQMIMENIKAILRYTNWDIYRIMWPYSVEKEVTLSKVGVIRSRGRSKSLSDFERHPTEHKWIEGINKG